MSSRMSAGRWRRWAPAAGASLDRGPRLTLVVVAGFEFVDFDFELLENQQQESFEDFVVAVAGGEEDLEKKVVLMSWSCCCSELEWRQ